MKIDKMYQKRPQRDEKNLNNNLQKLYAIVFFLCVAIYVFQMSQSITNIKENPKLFLEGEQKQLNRNILIEENIENSNSKDKNNNNNSNKNKNNNNENNNNEKEHKTYLSFEDVKEIFNENILFNEKQGQIILISLNHVAEYNIDKLEGILDGEKMKFEDKVQLKDKIPYISIYELKRIYDFDVNISENKVSIFRKNKESIILRLKKDTKLKSKDSLFAGTLKTLKKENPIQKISETKNKYKVLTENIQIGYIAKKNVESETKIRENQEDINQNSGTLKNANYILNFDNLNRNFDEVKKEEGKDNIVLISNFKISENGKIKNKYEFNNKGYQIYYDKLIKENLIPYGKIELKKEEKINIASKYEEFEKRNELINSIIEQVKVYNLKGIAFEIEEIKDEALFTRIILELKPRLKQMNIPLILPKSTTTILNIDKKVDGIY